MYSSTIKQFSPVVKYPSQLLNNQRSRNYKMRDEKNPDAHYIIFQLLVTIAYVPISANGTFVPRSGDYT